VEASLLVTKTLIPPSRPRLVSRPRLIERLHEGLGYDLVLVSAPAGFGKTTLLSEWARQDQPGVRTCWVSLDEGDSDPVRFWEYVILALQRFLPEMGGKILASLRSPQPPPTRSLVVALMNDLVGLSEDLVLALDDFQFVTSPDVHDAVSYLLDHLPPRVHLLIATRADPPLPLARLRGRGQMLEIGADDLRFTLEETAELLWELRGTQLAAEHVEALSERTEGWAVGLKMAALSMGQQQDVSGFIKSFAGSQRYVMDYLIEEVLQRQTSDVQDFLLKTSVLEKLTAPLCDEVTGRTDSGELLPALERANLLLVPLDESRQWFRYQHLFADLLRHQLAKAAGEVGVAELHKRASGWYKANGFLREAIDHALAARDWDAAAALIDEAGGRYFRTGEMVTLCAWLRALPEEIMVAKGLYGIYSWTLMFGGRPDEAEALLDRVEPTVGEDPVEHAYIDATRSLIETSRGNIPRSAELAQRALPLLPASDVEMRGAISLNLARMYMYRGSLEQAETLSREAYRDGMKAGNPWITMASLVMAAESSRLRGELSCAMELLEQALELAPGSPASAEVHLALALLLYERNELESAMSHVGTGLDLNRLLGVEIIQLGLLTASMVIAWASGDETQALQASEQLDQVAADSVVRDARLNQAMLHMALALRRDDLDEASRWGDRLVRLESEGPITYPVRLPFMRLLGVRGKKDELSQQTERLYRSAGVELLAPEWKAWLITVRLAQALAEPEQVEALGFVAEALRAGEPEGWIRSFVDWGPRLAPVLRKAVAHGICPDYAAKLLTIIGAEQRRRAESGRSPRFSPVYVVLTERELEVLRLVATGLSNRQIAGRLFISLGTVKVHLHNISEKLNATSRTGAVARAKELGLLK
jgi:LuxR family transcriptional regulator, maltose regulon positive regulatory protein